MNITSKLLVIACLAIVAIRASFVERIVEFREALEEENSGKVKELTPFFKDSRYTDGAFGALRDVVAGGKGRSIVVGVLGELATEWLTSSVSDVAARAGNTAVVVDVLKQGLEGADAYAMLKAALAEGKNETAEAMRTFHDAIKGALETAVDEKDKVVLEFILQGLEDDALSEADTRHPSIHSLIIAEQQKRRQPPAPVVSPPKPEPAIKEEVVPKPSSATIKEEPFKPIVPPPEPSAKLEEPSAPSSRSKRVPAKEKVALPEKIAFDVAEDEGGEEEAEVSDPTNVEYLDEARELSALPGFAEFESEVGKIGWDFIRQRVPEYIKHRTSNLATVKRYLAGFNSICNSTLRYEGVKKAYACELAVYWDLISLDEGVDCLASIDSYSKKDQYSSTVYANIFGDKWMAELEEFQESPILKKVIEAVNEPTGDFAKYIKSVVDLQGTHVDNVASAFVRGAVKLYKQNPKSALHRRMLFDFMTIQASRYLGSIGKQLHLETIYKLLRPGIPTALIAAPPRHAMVVIITKHPEEDDLYSEILVNSGGGTELYHAALRTKDGKEYKSPEGYTFIIPTVVYPFVRMKHLKASGFHIGYVQDVYHRYLYPPEGTHALMPERPSGGYRLKDYIRRQLSGTCTGTSNRFVMRYVIKGKQGALYEHQLDLVMLEEALQAHLDDARYCKHFVEEETADYIAKRKAAKTPDARKAVKYFDPEGYSFRHIQDAEQRKQLFLDELVVGFSERLIATIALQRQKDPLANDFLKAIQESFARIEAAYKPLPPLKGGTKKERKEHAEKIRDRELLQEGWDFVKDALSDLAVHASGSPAGMQPRRVVHVPKVQRDAIGALAKADFKADFIGSLGKALNAIMLAGTSPDLAALLDKKLPKKVAPEGQYLLLLYSLLGRHRKLFAHLLTRHGFSKEFSFYGGAEVPAATIASLETEHPEEDAVQRLANYEYSEHGSLDAVAAKVIV